MPGSQTTRGGANPRAGGPAPIAFCCHDGIGTPDYIAFAAHNLACTHPCQRFAGNLAALTHDSGPVWVATPFTVKDSHLQPPAGLPAHRGSMAGLCAPLPTLRHSPRGLRRTARGRCGLLLLHRSGLSPLTLCRFLPAHQKFLSSHAAVYNTFNLQRHLASAQAHRVLRAEAMDTWRTAAAIAQQLLRRRRFAFDARRRDKAI